MKIKLVLFPLLGIYLLLISATAIEIKDTTASVNNQVTTTIPAASTEVKFKKLNFFQRVIFKIFVRKDKLIDEGKGDNLASTSLSLGIGTWITLLLGLAVPYVILASVPLAIAAMITGKSALNNGTSKEGRAKTGRGLGLGGLITFAVLLIIAAIVVSSWSGDWNWN